MIELMLYIMKNYTTLKNLDLNIMMQLNEYTKDGFGYYYVNIIDLVTMNVK